MYREFTLCDGAVVRVSETVIATDPKWLEHLHDFYAARSKAIYGNRRRTEDTKAE